MGDTITGSAGGNDIYTIQVTAAGQLTFTLIDQIDHTFGDDAETNLPIDLGGLIEVVDEDGDALPAGAGNIVINVGDDIPQMCQPAALQVDEDALGDANADTPAVDGEANFGGSATDSFDLTMVVLGWPGPAWDLRVHGGRGCGAGCAAA